MNLGTPSEPEMLDLVWLGMVAASAIWVVGIGIGRICGLNDKERR